MLALGGDDDDVATAPNSLDVPPCAPSLMASMMPVDATGLPDGGGGCARRLTPFTLSEGAALATCGWLAVVACDVPAGAGDRVRDRCWRVLRDVPAAVLATVRRSAAPASPLLGAGATLESVGAALAVRVDAVAKLLCRLRARIAAAFACCLLRSRRVTGIVHVNNLNTSCVEVNRGGLCGWKSTRRVVSLPGTAAASSVCCAHMATSCATGAAKRRAQTINNVGEHHFSPAVTHAGPVAVRFAVFVLLAPQTAL